MLLKKSGLVFDVFTQMKLLLMLKKYSFALILFFLYISFSLYSQESFPDEDREKLVNYAQSELGKPYKFGTMGPDSYDCSGYIYSIYREFDVDMPRTSQAQAKAGKEIMIEEVKKGDLLFFKSPSPNNPNIGHVGIVIYNEEGVVKFIHSSTGRGVVIDGLQNSYERRYMMARRVLGD